LNTGILVGQRNWRKRWDHRRQAVEELRRRSPCHRSRRCYVEYQTPSWLLAPLRQNDMLERNRVTGENRNGGKAASANRNETPFWSNIYISCLCHVRALGEVLHKVASSCVAVHRPLLCSHVLCPACRRSSRRFNRCILLCP
jgi:hypothetical protein